MDWEPDTDIDALMDWEPDNDLDALLLTIVREEADSRRTDPLDANTRTGGMVAVRKHSIEK
jgi:hypothetical protein